MNEPYEGDPRAYCAIARVDDDDPINILERDGQVLGMAVDCTIVDGVFVGCRVAAKLCAPLGQATPNLPGPGDYIVLMLPHGHLDGPILATHAMPGGIAKPMPSAVAGIDVSNVEALSKVQLVAPPKGVGVRHYIRSAPYVVRLKGTAELYLDADDGTFIRILKDPSTGKMGAVMRDGTGAQIQVSGGVASMTSPDGSSVLAVENGKVKIVTDELTLNAKVQKQDGLILHNVPPNAPIVPGTPGPMNAIRFGSGPPAHAPSAGTFIGV
ncbi:MAG TPA: hypothetical protein VFS43_38420 [Polyangiaceae bacterium]|nr:hypothetical protein [Polyangiaceae bacterium]